MERQPKSKLNQQIYEEACEWFIEFRSGTMDAERCREADRWLRKSPEQVSAYLEIAGIWNEGAALIPPDLYPIDELIADARKTEHNVVAFNASSNEVDSVEHDIGATHRSDGAEAGPLRQTAPVLTPRQYSESWNRGTSPWRSSRSSFLVRTTCATVVAGALIAGSLWYVDTVRAPMIATQVGEQRSFELTDGSTVSLNSRSKIRVRYSEHRRDVELIEGQALFHVAKDGARPFVVDAHGTKVRAVGTEFDVYQKQAGTLVTVVEGRVAILTDHPPDEASRNLSLDSSSGTSTDSTPVAPELLFPPGSTGTSENILLGAGEQLSVMHNRVLKLDHANLASATAWTHRELIFDFATLADVAEEFNRYNVRPLVIVDPGLDTFHITGMFSSTDPASIIRFLNSRPGLRVVETPSSIRIERKTS